MADDVVNEKRLHTRADVADAEGDAVPHLWHHGILIGWIVTYNEIDHFSNALQSLRGLGSLLQSHLTLRCGHAPSQ